MATASSRISRIPSSAFAPEATSWEPAAGKEMSQYRNVLSDPGSSTMHSPGLSWEMPVNTVLGATVFQKVNTWVKPRRSMPGRPTRGSMALTVEENTRLSPRCV